HLGRVRLVHALDRVVGRQRAGDDLPEPFDVTGVQPEPVPARDASKVIIGRWRDGHGNLLATSKTRGREPTRAPSRPPRAPIAARHTLLLVAPALVCAMPFSCAGRSPDGRR